MFSIHTTSNEQKFYICHGSGCSGFQCLSIDLEQDWLGQTVLHGIFTEQATNCVAILPFYRFCDCFRFQYIFDLTRKNRALHSPSEGQNANDKELSCSREKKHTKADRPVELIFILGRYALGAKWLNS